MVKSPETLLEATAYFSDPQNCLDYMTAKRWPNGVTCPVCGSKSVSYLAKVNRFQCSKSHGKRQFTCKTGSIFEDSALPLEKWLIAMWLIVNAKNGIASWEIHRALGVTQKTGWFMLHRIRNAMANGTIEKLSGEVEVDESYFGGRSRGTGRHGRGASGKTPVVGAIERGGNVVTMLSQNMSHMSLTPFVAATVKQDAKVYTDDWAGYNKLSAAGFAHQTINHSSGVYVQGLVHRQSIENFWSLVKRTIRGTYVSVEPIHLHRYLGEYGFRFNARKSNDGQRFSKLMGQITNRRLTYAELIGKAFS